MHVQGRRPKKLNTGLTRTQEVRLRRRWRSWLERIVDDLTDLMTKRKLFLELMEIVNADPRTREPGAFVGWLLGNYATTIAVGIRRATDVHRKSRSIGRLIFEALEHPKVITLAAHRRLYKRTKWSADGTFHGIAGKGRVYLSGRVVRGHMRELERAERRIRPYVNKRVAHLAAPGALRTVATFDDLHRALDVLDRIVLKYYVLLTAKYMPSTMPIVAFEWRGALRNAWWTPRNAAQPER